MHSSGSSYRSVAITWWHHMVFSGVEGRASTAVEFREGKGMHSNGAHQVLARLLQDLDLIHFAPLALQRAQLLHLQHHWIQHLLKPAVSKLVSGWVNE